MSKVKDFQIRLNDYYDSQILSRKAVKQLFNEIDKTNKIILDFNKITFVSRSAFHQFLIESEKIKYIKFINMNADLKKLFSIVKSTYKKKNLHQSLQLPNSDQHQPLSAF